MNEAKRGAEWINLLPEDVRVLVIKDLLEHLMDYDLVRWSQGCENSNPCLYWKSSGEPLDEAVSDVVSESLLKSYTEGMGDAWLEHQAEEYWKQQRSSETENEDEGEDEDE